MMKKVILFYLSAFEKGFAALSKVVEIQHFKYFAYSLAQLVNRSPSQLKTAFVNSEVLV